MENEIYDDCAINKEMILKGQTYCKVVEMSMQCCGQILKDSFETYKTF